jgi:hypothetical protein
MCAIQLLDLLTLGLWSKLGRFTHYAFDAVLRKYPRNSPVLFRLLVLGEMGRKEREGKGTRLTWLATPVSAFLAGMKRSTGLT